MVRQFRIGRYALQRYPLAGTAGHKLTFYEMGDEIPDGAAGDVFIVLDVQEHALFKRKGCDLYLKRDISLVEALCGFSLEIEHLDGRKLLVNSAPGVSTYRVWWLGGVRASHEPCSGCNTTGRVQPVRR